jgi:hypothetical protein
MTQTNLQNNHNTTTHLGELERLTRGYARFSQNAAGLGNVLGGVLAMAMWLSANLTELPLWARLLFAAVPIGWIVAKETLRHRYYLRHGLVREAPDGSEQRFHVGLTAFTALVSLAIVTVVGYGLLTGAPLTWQTLGYLALVISLPVFVWFHMRTTEEYLVGVLLFVQAAVILAGGRYDVSWQNAYFPLFALIAIVAGVKQHLDYRKLNRALQRLRRQV